MPTSAVFYAVVQKIMHLIFVFHTLSDEFHVQGFGDSNDLIHQSGAVLSIGNPIHKGLVDFQKV